MTLCQGQTSLAISSSMGSQISSIPLSTLVGILFTLISFRFLVGSETLWMANDRYERSFAPFFPSFHFCFYWPPFDEDIQTVVENVVSFEELILLTNTIRRRLTTIYDPSHNIRTPSFHRQSQQFLFRHKKELNPLNGSCPNFRPNDRDRVHSRTANRILTQWQHQPYLDVLLEQYKEKDVEIYLKKNDGGGFPKTQRLSVPMRGQP